MYRIRYLLTYLRIYQGVIKKGDFITNVNTGKKIKIPCLGKRHYGKIKEVDEAHAGEIVFVFGAILRSGDTFTDGSVRYIMTSADVLRLKSFWREIFKWCEWIHSRELILLRQLVWLVNYALAQGEERK
ncbi:elongation factor G, mitochondrial [Medicago truncatula]|uniref:Elongation factor Tu domain protein n=1 Tax=Medicago truncatula TaxID=3880 RepID=G7LAJ3_MEDTR|nr:elongation factor G, mitochondrial [Medicago truncatula]AET05401.2 elongation factor Tu domain protein [Medicago truncatula]